MCLYFGGHRPLSDAYSTLGGYFFLRIRGTKSLAGTDISYSPCQRSYFPPSFQIVNNERRVIQPPSRLQQILSSCGPIVFIVPDVADSPGRELSVALRIAHDMNVHHRLDAEIVLESEALPLLAAGPWSNGNIVYIGKPSSTFVRSVLAEKKTSFGFTATSALELKNEALDGSCCM
jgi:hypothetical protein